MRDAHVLHEDGDWKLVQFDYGMKIITLQHDIHGNPKDNTDVLCLYNQCHGIYHCFHCEETPTSKLIAMLLLCEKS